MDGSTNDGSPLKLHDMHQLLHYLLVGACATIKAAVRTRQVSISVAHRIRILASMPVSTLEVSSTLKVWTAISP